MDKQYFVLKLIPCRPEFSKTMTNEERAIMQEHICFWKEYMEKGIVLVFGPVLDPKETYGLGILAVDSEDQVKELIAKDPATKINNTYEYYPMMAITPKK